MSVLSVTQQFQIRIRNQIQSRCAAFISANTAVFLLALLLLQVSALGVIYSTYKNRQLFSSLEELRSGAEEMQVSWRQLLLEKSTLASFDHVMTVAQGELAMAVPNPEKIIILQAAGR